MSHPTIVDNPADSAVASTVERLREAGIMSIRLHEERRPEMVALVVFLLDRQPVGGGSAVLIFDVDHWAAGPNLPEAYFDYLGDRWTRPNQLVKSVLAILTRAR